ncbi:thioredoxin family protein [Streptococcus ictaluri]|uniref:thioredoxin family protein n=1 Tax=Streptococcus ictaluri TaxID=380397 RepID=UPI0009FE43F7|nr:thioredoxin family protein [Streptococcus ictaluri]
MSQNVVDHLSVKILGSGCKKCNLLEEHVRQAFLELDLPVRIAHEKDFATICSYGVMALWRYGVMALWRYGVMALWRYGVMALWRYGVMALWQPLP